MFPLLENMVPFFRASVFATLMPRIFPAIQAMNPMRNICTKDMRKTFSIVRSIFAT